MKASFLINWSYSVHVLFVSHLLLVNFKSMVEGFVPILTRDPNTLLSENPLGVNMPLIHKSAALSKRGGALLLHESKNTESYNPDTTTTNLPIKSSPSSTPPPYLTVLLPLVLVYISNQWSRYSISYLVDFSESATSYKAMNVDLNFDQAQYGTLASIAFTFLFAGTSLVAGNLADKYDRRLLTVGACVAWSLATLGTASSADYTQVVICRIAMGLMCAFATPSAYTLIRDTFPKDTTAFAASLYGAGVYLGGALSSLSILLDNEWGWRATMSTITAFGLLSAGSAFIALKPDDKGITTTTITTPSDEKLMSVRAKDDDNDTTNKASVISGALSILSNPRVRLLFLASFLRFCAGLCIAVWAAPYFRLTFPNDSQSYSVVNAVIVSVCGLTSSVVGGALADKASKLSSTSIWVKDENFGKLLVPIIGSFLAVPAWWMVIHAETFQLSMVWLAIEYLVAECWFGPVIAVLQSSVESNKGGLAQGMFTLTGALANLAPALLGTMYYESKVLGEGGEMMMSTNLSTLLGVGVCLAYLTSSIAFVLCAQSSTATSSLNTDPKQP